MSLPSPFLDAALFPSILSSVYVASALSRLLIFAGNLCLFCLSEDRSPFFTTLSYSTKLQHQDARQSPWLKINNYALLTRLQISRSANKLAIIYRKTTAIVVQLTVQGLWATEYHLDCHHQPMAKSVSVTVFGDSICGMFYNLNLAAL